MKKALIYGMSAALLLASLTACNKPQADQQNTEPNPTQAATSTPAPEEPTTTPEPEVTQEPTTQTPAAPEQLSSTTQAAPDENKASQPAEETDPQEPAEEVQLFTDCNETVYATGTVNIRESWTVNSTKIGSLTKGQSVTRIGTAIEGSEADGWSRVDFEGQIVYIASSYLSTTKPTTQSTSNNGGGTTQTTKPSGSQGTTQTQPSGGGTSTSNSDDDLAAKLEAMMQQSGGVGGNRDHPLTDEEAASIAGQVNLVP